jgi:hypothetical protein
VRPTVVATRPPSLPSARATAPVGDLDGSGAE